MKKEDAFERYTANQIRDGIFSLNTRRFGAVAEHLVKILANAKWGNDISHDLFDEKMKTRIEVKFSRALRKNQNIIQASNILTEIINAGQSDRMFASSEWETCSFDCNIQQIKKKQFDLLYYGIFFSDKLQVFKLTSKQIGKGISYSDKQHFGNKGEGQFHLNNKTYPYRLKHFLEAELSYQDVLSYLIRLQRAGKLDEILLLVLLPLLVPKGSSSLKR
jgi:hypothetical protein